MRWGWVLVLAALAAGTDCLKVSVITPTFDVRASMHPALYRAFAGQTHQRRELIVVDDAPSPSTFFMQLEDRRVTYVYRPSANSETLPPVLRGSRCSDDWGEAELGHRLCNGVSGPCPLP